MKIRLRKETRNSIGYYLSPEVLTIALPESLTAESRELLESAVSETNTNGLTGCLTNREIRQMVQSWKNKLGVKTGNVQVRRLRNKWASCSPSRNITLNEKLLNMPKQFVEYVICHELLHLKVRRHNKLFKNLLSAYMPDWQERLTKTVERIIGGRIESAVRASLTLKGKPDTFPALLPPYPRHKPVTNIFTHNN